jgi:chromosome segregation ATPase|tara:strand:- start:290 stop:541 length:252 start_codon:yes stop_codon:yes gene_type:complete
MVDFDGMTRRFLANEGKKPGIRAYMNSLKDSIARLRPSSQSQAVMIENIKSNLRSVRREVESLQEQVTSLREQLQVLEENKEK